MARAELTLILHAGGTTIRALVLTLSLLLTAIAALVLLNAVTPWEAAYADAATKWLALKPCAAALR